MKLKGFFMFLGMESSPEGSEKIWHRIGLTQGLHSQIFYVGDDVVWEKIKKLGLKTGQQVSAEISISESKGKTYFSISDIELA